MSAGFRQNQTSDDIVPVWCPGSEGTHRTLPHVVLTGSVSGRLSDRTRLVSVSNWVTPSFYLPPRRPLNFDVAPNEIQASSPQFSSCLRYFSFTGQNTAEALL